MSKSHKHTKRRPTGFGRGIRRRQKPNCFIFSITKEASAAKGYRWQREYRGLPDYDCELL